MIRRPHSAEAPSRRWLWVWACGVVLFLAFFGEVLVQGRAYDGGDLARLYLPQRVALVRALKDFRLPWWNAQMGLGYPLLAEGETGALYPLYWLLAAWPSPAVGISLSIIAHYAIAAVGFYRWARQMGRSREAALITAIIPTLGGFGVAHLSHLSIIAVMAWHPWMLLETYALLARPRGPRQGGRVAALAAFTGLQFLAGHPQMSLLGGMLVAAYALYLLWERRRERPWRGLALWLGGLAGGILLGAPQLLPSLELTLLSQRAGGLDPAFFTSYSFHPFLAATYLSPFVLGNPYPEGSIELMGYVGILPLALGWAGLTRRHERPPWFWLAMGLVGFVLAWGRWNPAYRLLSQVPVLNLFRVPARYLYWVTLALAILAGAGWDALAPQRAAPRRGVSALCAFVAIAALGLAAWCQGSPGVEALIALWKWLPLAWAIGTGILFFSMRGAYRPLWVAAAFCLLAADLYAFGAVLDRTYNASRPAAEIARPPAVLALLQKEEAPYRIYTKEEILPALSVMEASLYPNMNVTHGVASANLYAPLLPEAYRRYMADLTAERLNRLNVRYELIPQLLPVDAASELYDVLNPFSALPLGKWVELPEETVADLEVESYLSHATDLPDGTLAAEIILRTAGGEQITLPLRAGLETAEWAYERSDVLAKVAHRKAQVASTWPASSGFPPEEHPGHTYLARWSWPTPLRVTGIFLRPILPEAFVRIERLRWEDAAGRSTLLNHRLGLGDHTIVYRSEDVLVYRNEDALPRAYTLPQRAVIRHGKALDLPPGSLKGLAQPAAIHTYADERVHLTAQVEEPSYLILADLFYPGWEATVDGTPAPILVADGVFRAVFLAPGEHEVIFRYRPLALRGLLHRR